MLSLIQTEVVRNHHWLTSAEFTNVVAISQMTPGPIGINTSDLLWLHSCALNGLRSGHECIGKRHCYLCISVANLYPYGSNNKDVYALYEDNCGAKRVRRLATSRCWTLSCCDIDVDE